MSKRLDRIKRMPRRIAPWWRRFKRNGYRPDRCEHCGHRFRWRRDARHASGNRDGKVWHGPCMAYQVWRTKADERLAILALTLDVTGATDRDIKVAAEFRADRGDERVTASNRAFRVFYDLEKSAHLRHHLTDGSWHDNCEFCLNRRTRGGTGVEDAAALRSPASPVRSRNPAHRRADCWCGQHHAPEDFL